MFFCIQIQFFVLCYVEKSILKINLNLPVVFFLLKFVTKGRLTQHDKIA